jgi:subfamily B ATP-binding cassette protein HlyB/CyaB
MDGRAAESFSPKQFSRVSNSLQIHLGPVERYGWAGRCRLLVGQRELGGAGVNISADGARDPALSCFVLLARFLGVPADPQQIAHDRGKGEDPYTLEDLSRISKKLGLVGRIRRCAADELRKMPLPALAQLSDGDAAVILKIEDDPNSSRALVQFGDRERPEVWTGEELRERFAGRLLLMTSRERMAGASRPFDISWFIPALVKYRRPLRDVLIGSFFLQLMGLISPIFFQLVID